jgi:DNA-binding LacI/PurR family transcriptional regulator
MHELGYDDYVRFVPGGLTDEDGERAAGELWADGSPPTAVTAFNDHCAAGLLQTARGCGVDVPGELSVVGYDDSHVAGLSSIALTTVAQDAAALAVEAVTLAIGRAEDGERVPQEVVVPPRLVVRSTTAPPGQRSTSVVS